MNELTQEEFNQMLSNKNCYVKKWIDLKKNNIYTISDYRKIETNTGQRIILTLINDGCTQDVWCPTRLANMIDGKEPPFYVRPLGLKPCKYKHHSFDLVIPENPEAPVNMYS